MNLRRTTSFAVAAALAAATLTGVPALAHADAASATASQTVRYDDLNLSSEAGVQALYRRIQNAARDVCGPSTVTGTRIESEAWKDCVSSAVRQAILAVNKPQLTAYYSDRLRIPVSRTPG